MKDKKIQSIVIIAFGVSMNFIGTLIAFTFKLPICLDSIGTIMNSFLLGPLSGIVTGIMGSFICGITFDIYSLYFAPVQVATGFFAGYLYRKSYLKGRILPISILVISLFSASIGAVISAYVFNGITSSGSSIIVIFLRNIGLNKVLSVFIVQYLIDYIDKFISCALIITILNRISKNSIIRSCGGENGEI
ncbi:ECF transporter S component [Hathewaya histolytica]|uniref:Integral membrane protein n=1 Tax=Hathewaya histolytica TaxID=1498 RepID=A0A4U9RF46_HATHI|nr:ECF transporter S component [Hathewaya histolytica]VTQ90482.1 integral membrane protein [Hathewaya histolytica]